MTEPQMDRNIGQTLELWMDQVAPERAPTRLLEETFSRTMTTHQAGTYPWDRLRPPALAPAWAPSQAWLLLLAVALIVVALGVGWGLGGGWFAAPAPPGPSPSLAPSLSPSPSYAVVASPPDPAPISITPEAVVAVTKPIGMASDGEALWVLTETGGLVRIDPATNNASEPIQLGGEFDLYNGVSADANGVWASHWSPGIVYRVDPTTGTLAAAIETDLAKGVLATAGGVWVAHTHDGAVSRIDPATNKIAATILVGPTGNSGPNWLASGLGSIWVGVPNGSVVVRIDPATDEVQARIAIPSQASPCGGLAVGDDAVWIPSCDGSDWLTRIDPATNSVVALIDMGGRGFSPMIISRAPWISVDRGDDPAAIFRIDPATNEFDRVLAPDMTFRGGGDMAVAAGSLWIVDSANDQVLRLRLSAFAP
jgi:streptogramin lyase